MPAANEEAERRSIASLDDTAKPQNNVQQLEMGVNEETLRQHELQAELQEALRNYTPGTAAEKKLLRKIDLRLMPVLWIMYILNYVDRTNIGNAKTAGMADALNLDDQRYAWVISIFFFGYLLCEVPSNMILSRTKPSWFLPGIMIVWGALSAAMSASKTYGAMLAFRFIVGCIESGFFPGVLYLLSCWYTSAELGKRFTIFYTASTLSGAFGGLLAGAITDHLHNAHGIAGWRWLFIVEGVATTGVAMIAIFILPDYPSTTAALTLEERQLATIRLLADGSSSSSNSSKDDDSSAARLSHREAFMAAVVDYRTWYFLIMIVLNVGAGTISYFIPTLTETLGYKGATAQYMTVPVYIVAAVIANCAAFSADRLHERRLHVATFYALGCACAIVCAAVTQPIVRYVMLCFTAAGIWTALPIALTWISQTMGAPAEKRAIVLALVNAFGNLSSVYGSRIWPDSDGPNYPIGWGVTAGFLGGATVLALLAPLAFRAPVKRTPAELRMVEALGQGGAAGEDRGAVVREGDGNGDEEAAAPAAAAAAAAGVGAKL